MKNIIEKLSDMRGVSGFEYRITDKIANMFKPYCDEVKIDALGSVIAHKKSNIKNAPKVMIEAHCDEIGLIVNNITDDGYITFSNVGGVDNRILPSLEVVVHGREDIKGVIGIKPDFLLEKDKTVKIKDMAVDTGLDADSVKKLVSVGDSITIAQSVGELGKKQWSGKSLDDRAGVAALIDVLKNINNERICADVYAVATVQEEVGCRGAKTSAFSINPDLAVAIDVTHAKTPDNSDCEFETGSGVVISTGPNIHPQLYKRLVSICEDNKIKYDIEVEAGDTGTDAWEIQTARDGIPTALLSIPLKYMHTSVETISVADVKAISKLLETLIKSIEEDVKWLSL